MEPIILNLGNGFGIQIPHEKSMLTIKKVTIEYEREDDFSKEHCILTTKEHLK